MINVLYPIALVCRDGEPIKVRVACLSLNENFVLTRECNVNQGVVTVDLEISQLSGLKKWDTFYSTPAYTPMLPEADLILVAPRTESYEDIAFHEEFALNTRVQLPRVSEDGVLLSEVSRVILFAVFVDTLVVISPEGTVNCAVLIDYNGNMEFELRDNLVTLPDAKLLSLLAQPRVLLRCEKGTNINRTSVIGDPVFRECLTSLGHIVKLPPNQEIVCYPAFPELCNYSLALNSDKRAEELTVVLPEVAALSSSIYGYNEEVTIVGSDKLHFVDLNLNGIKIKNITLEKSDANVYLSLVSTPVKGTVSLTAPKVCVSTTHTNKITEISGCIRLCADKSVVVFDQYGVMIPVCLSALTECENSEAYISLPRTKIPEQWLEIEGIAPKTISISAIDQRALFNIDAPNSALSISGDPILEFRNIRVKRLQAKSRDTEAAVTTENVHCDYLQHIVDGKYAPPWRKLRWDFSGVTCNTYKLCHSTDIPTAHAGKFVFPIANKLLIDYKL